MSVEARVHLDRARAPSSAAWVDAIAAAGFPLELDREFEPTTFAGFLPCTYEGREAGFEYFFVDASEPMPGGDAPGVAARDSVASLVTGSRADDLAAATIAAAVLADLSDGVLYDCESGELVEADAAVAWANEQLDGGSEGDGAPFQVVGGPAPYPWLGLAVGAVVFAVSLVYVWLVT